LLVPLEFEAVDPGPPSQVVELDEPDGRPAADLEGRYIIGRLGSEPGQMMLPAGVALDGVGNIYVVDSGNARVQKFDPRGTLLGAVGSAGVEPGQFNVASDIAIDAAGNVYVVDTWNHRIQKFAPDLTAAGGWGQATNDLMNPVPGAMWGPRGIAIDKEGNILIADAGTHRIRRHAPDGAHLGDFGRRGKEAGEFEEPTGIAVGPDGAVTWRKRQRAHPEVRRGRQFRGRVADRGLGGATPSQQAADRGAAGRAPDRDRRAARPSAAYRQ
jgi:hypothetical protein